MPSGLTRGAEGALLLSMLFSRGRPQGETALRQDSRLVASLRPHSTISDADVQKGLRWLVREGMASVGFNSVTTSGILAAFALALGADSMQIGILAAIPFLTQPLQLPTTLLVERLRWRKAIATSSWFLAQLLWIPLALIPLFVAGPGNTAIALLLGIMTLRGLFNAVSNCAWNSWIRDLVPQNSLGRVFARRLGYATAVAMVFGLGAAVFVDVWSGRTSGWDSLTGYTLVLLGGAVFIGLTSPLSMLFIPEPRMVSRSGDLPSLWQMVLGPLRDLNYRRMVQFLLVWGFASNLAVPFFAVYMLQRLGLPLTWVIGLGLVSQVANLGFLRVWGSFVDKYSNKMILWLCSSLYVLVIFGWTFTTMPEQYFLTLPLLVTLHIFAGIATAGVTLTVGTIGLKLAPQGNSTEYLASASLATNVGMGLGPIAGGILAQRFTGYDLELLLTWTGPDSHVVIPTFSIVGLDFVFGIATVLGLMRLGTLALVREEGEVSKEVVLESLMAPLREMSRSMSSMPVLNFISNFSAGNLRRVSVPGLDVAIGVTAFQLAEMARVAAVATVRGRTLTSRLANRLEKELSPTVSSHDAAQMHGAEIARSAARGAMHVLDGRTLDAGKVAAKVVEGVVSASSHLGVVPSEAIAGAAQGIMEGASETSSDLAVVATQAVEAARHVAGAAGLTEDEASAQAVAAVLDAAHAIGEEADHAVRMALPHELVEVSDSEDTAPTAER